MAEQVKLAPEASGNRLPPLPKQEISCLSGVPQVKSGAQRMASLRLQDNLGSMELMQQFDRKSQSRWRASFMIGLDRLLFEIVK